MSHITDNRSQDAGTEEAGGEDMQRRADEAGFAQDTGTTSGKFREASYVVLFIAAIFVVNAMETGSYRTPWPVAIVAALAGLGLFGYSWYLQSQTDKNSV